MPRQSQGSHVRSIITGDLHLSNNPRDAYRFEFMDWFASFCRSRKPDRIIIAGDLTEDKDRHPSALVNRVVDHAHVLAKIAPLDCLEGNHDYKEENQAFFRFLSRIPNTRWISKPSVRGDVLMLPHTNNYKRDWSGIDLAAYGTIVCHQTFNGANVGFGRTLDGISLDVLPRKSITLCGDIHVPQEMGRLAYIGAPYHVDFGDDYKARVIELTDGLWVGVDTSTLPQKRALHIGLADDITDCHFNEGDIVQITVDVDDMGGWQPLRDHLMKQAESRKLRVWAIKPRLTKLAVRRRHKVTDHQTDVEVLDAYAARHSLTPAVLRTGQKLLKA
jgi:calcineurin-like phosphoesterase family protein